MIPAELEYPLLKSQLEVLNRTVRSAQKDLESQCDLLQKAVIKVSGNKASDVNKDGAIKLWNAFAQRLRGVKRKLEEYEQEENKQWMTMKKRLDHLVPLQQAVMTDGESAAAQAPTAAASSGGDEAMVDADEEQQTVPQQTAESTESQSAALSPEDEKFIEYQWNSTRVYRIVIDFLLRTGAYRAAEELARTTDCEALCDVSLFQKMRSISEALTVKHSCTEALEWCAENKARLKKIKSNLEFELRLQEMLELVKQNKKLDAIAYARKHLTTQTALADADSVPSEQLTAIRQVMASIIYGTQTRVPRYKELFSENRWKLLADQFLRDNYALYNLTSAPLININLQSGLSALKLPQCYIDPNVNDPLSQPEYRKLAEHLPFAFHLHSKIVCRLTGRLMDHDNPPLILPNGNAYSTEAMMAMSKENNGRVIDPITKEAFEFSQLKRGLII